MKNVTLLTIAIFIVLCPYTKAQVDVTINVDMSDVADFDSTTRQLDYAGSFDGWAAFHPLTYSEGEIYTVIFTDVASGYYGGDVYHNDKGSPDWGTYGEWSGALTGIDIMVYVGEEDVTLNVKWDATYSMTCNVDMNDVTEFDAVADSVYFINGDVGALNESVMTDDNDDGIYTVTFAGIPSGHFPAVFAYGPSAEELTYEWEYASNKGLRVLTLEGADVDETFIFGEAEGEIKEGVDVTINVDMSDVADFDTNSRQLDYAGSFDGWAAFHPVTYSEGENYTVTFSDVASGYYGGDVYHNDKGSPDWGTYGEWSGAPTGIDIMVYVGEEDVTLNVKWGVTYSMTCNVDMNDVAEFDAVTDSVYFINGDVGLLNESVMTDDNDDGIYTVTFTGIPSGHFPTVFAYGHSVDDLTYEWEYASNKGLRVLTLEGADVDETFKFGEAEGEIKEGVDVTINLDMRETDLDENTEVLYISGDMNGWAAPGDDTCYKFSKSGVGTYTLTLTGVASGYYANDFYRDVEGSESWGANGEWSGGPTGIDVMILVGEENVILNSRWGETFSMTFRVDMNEVSEFNSTSDTVYYINEGVWALNQTVMTDDDANGIYTVTFNEVPQGHYPSIFAYGSVAGELTYEWTWSELTTRVLTIENTDIDKTYKFSEAEGINTGIPERILQDQGSISVYPNPVNNGIININTHYLSTGAIIKLFNLQGREVYSNTLQRPSANTIDVNHLAKGLYILSISDGERSLNMKLIIE
jgi:hypothetical protein